MRLYEKQIEWLHQALSESQRAIETLQRQTDHDPMTHALNRRGFTRQLERLVKYCKRYNIKAGLIYCDLDDLKTINDTYGHAVGDLVLKRIGRIIKRHIRDSGDFVGRLGGDEFALVLLHITPDHLANKLAYLTRTIARTILKTNDIRLSFSISAGSCMIDGSLSARVVLERADVAMYAQKKHQKT